MLQLCEEFLKVLDEKGAETTDLWEMHLGHAKELEQFKTNYLEQRAEAV